MTSSIPCSSSSSPRSRLSTPKSNGRARSGPDRRGEEPTERPYVLRVELRGVQATEHLKEAGVGLFVRRESILAGAERTDVQTSAARDLDDLLLPVTPSTGTASNSATQRVSCYTFVTNSTAESVR
jgi:hypothetical protein